MVAPPGGRQGHYGDQRFAADGVLHKARQLRLRQFGAHDEMLEVDDAKQRATRAHRLTDRHVDRRHDSIDWCSER